MLNATVTERIDLTESLFLLKIKPDETHKPFKAGQYIALGLPGSAQRDSRYGSDPEEVREDKLIKRAYSIASNPSHPEELEFCIVVVEDGLFTPRLAPLKVGDRIFTAKRIVGTFTLDPVPRGSNIILVSTGTGIAPFLSMLRTDEVWNDFGQIYVVHGVRHSCDLCYRQELLKIEQQHSQLHYFATVSREDGEWSGPRGYVQGFFERGDIPLDASTDHILMCGNPRMIEDVRALAEAKGLKLHSKKEPGSIHVEEYW